MPIGHWQVPGEELDVADWPPDQKHPFFPEGSRDKRLLGCPQPAPQPWLVGGHRYLFKKSRRVYPDQFWAEVVASRLSRITNVPVPPAYAGWDSSSGECGAVIEWFYDYPDSPPQGLMSGGQLMKASIPDFDHQRGKQHNFQTIETWCVVLARPHAPGQSGLQLAGDWASIWGRMLTFDALIGNTDRHQENWGFLWTLLPGQGARPLALSPAFDNGTSLGHERQPDQFARFNDPAYLEHYVDRGHHPIPLSVERAHFMLTLLKARREHLLRALAP